jgi:hypothetical protein
MVNTRRRISAQALDERLLQQTAIEDAAGLFRAYGVAAIDIVNDGLLDQSKTPAGRRHDRLMIIELERLDRLQRQGPRAGQIIVWKPPLFSLATLRALFRAKDSRRLR